MKDSSEFAIHFYPNACLLYPINQLKKQKFISSEWEEISKNSHIYMITKIPQFSFCSKTFLYKNNKLWGNIKYKIKGVERTIPFKKPFKLSDNAVELKLSDFPHREITTFDKNGEEVSSLPAFMIALNEARKYKNNEIINLEVLYIGQAYGKGTISAKDRLSSGHTTLQQILSDCVVDFPDDEIYTLNFEYAPYEVTALMKGYTNTIVKNDKKSVNKLYNIKENPLTKHQQICLIEAGLISYFKPKYNKHYKENFPNKQKILDECYKLDFSGLMININIIEIGFYLFSTTISVPQQLHISEINLLNDKDRESFFNIFSDRKKL